MFGSKKRKQKEYEKIEKRVLSLTDGKDYGLCPPPMDAQVAVNELAKHFLGDDWYSVMPISNSQINTEIVMKIEMRYKGARKNNRRGKHA